MTTAAAASFQTLALSDLHESPHNPRKHFDQAGLHELAESLKTVGILTPLLVRPNGKGYEIAAGHRRFRAAKLAKLEAVPCVIRPLTDQQIMEILTIENLQREDVHPLDEATGYEHLMAAPYKMPVEQIAARVGRSVKYVYDRVKLLKLCKAAQTLFWDGKIEAGHAILLARLSAEDQREVIGSKEANYADGGLLTHQSDLYDEHEGDDEACLLKAHSVREVGDWIKRHIRFDMKSVDRFLYPETAAQIEATHGAKLALVEITTEYLCSDAVRSEDRKTRVFGERAWKRADGKDGSKTCAFSRLGVNVSGKAQGESYYVCLNKDRCDVHWAKEKTQRVKATKEREKTLKEAGGDKEKARELQMKKERAEQLARAEERAVLWAVIEHVMQKVKIVKGEDLALVAVNLLEALTNNDIEHEGCALLGFAATHASREMVAKRVAKEKDPLKLMFLASLLANLTSYDDPGKQILAAAKRHKVDVAKVRKHIKAEYVKHPPKLDEEED